MSKSLGNAIFLSDDAGDGAPQGAAACTPTRTGCAADVPGTVEGNPVFVYHDAFNPDRAEVADSRSATGPGGWATWR